MYICGSARLVRAGSAGFASENAALRRLTLHRVRVGTGGAVAATRRLARATRPRSRLARARVLSPPPLVAPPLAARAAAPRAIMRARALDARDAPPPSPPSEDAVAVRGAPPVEERCCRSSSEILMSLAIIELALGVLVVLGVLFACAYVAGFRKRRLPELAPARIAARVPRSRAPSAARPAALARLHVVARRPRDVRAGAEPRRVARPRPAAAGGRAGAALRRPPRPDVHAAHALHGRLCRAPLLLLVLGVVRSKTAAAPPPRWRVAAMLRRALLCALPFAILQVVFVLLPLFGLWSNEFVEPQPQPPAPTNRTAGGGKRVRAAPSPTTRRSGRGGTPRAARRRTRRRSPPPPSWCRSRARGRWRATGKLGRRAIRRRAILRRAIPRRRVTRRPPSHQAVDPRAPNARLRQRLYVRNSARSRSVPRCSSCSVRGSCCPTAGASCRGSWPTPSCSSRSSRATSPRARSSARPVREAPPDARRRPAAPPAPLHARARRRRCPLRHLGAGELQLLVQTISPPRRGSAARRASAPAAAAAAYRRRRAATAGQGLGAKSSEERERERSRGASAFGERRTVPGGDRMTSACPSFATAQAPAPAIETRAR